MNDDANLIGTDGRPISERDVQRGLRLNIVAGSLGNAWVGMTMGIPLVMMLQALGARGVFIGLATTLQQLAMMVQIPASFVAERFSTRKRFWATMNLPHRLLWFIPAVLPFLWPHDPALVVRLLLVLVAVSSLLAQAGTACWYSWMADLVPEEISGRFWGRRQSTVMVAYLVAIGLVGWLLDAVPDPRKPGGSFLGFSIVFAVGALLGTADILTHLLVPEPTARRSKQPISLIKRLMAPLRNADFRWLSLSLGVWAFAMGLIGSFSIVYLKREFDLNYSHLAALTLGASLGAIIFGFPCGYAIDRLGARTFGTVMYVIGPLTGLGWFFLAKTNIAFAVPGWGVLSVPQPVALLFLASALAGGLYSGIGLAQIRLLTALTPSEGRTMAMAVHWTIIGLTASLGPLLGGAIMDWFDSHPVAWVLPTGMTFSFFHVLVLMQMLLAWFVAVPLLLKVSLRKGDLPIGTALPRLWLGNPVQAVRNLYNIYAITAAVSAPERAKAVRGLGVSRTALAVEDLIVNLDDPSLDVREEAVVALGQIGNAEAVQALLAKLDDPDTDLAPHIARALRQTRSPRVVPALIRKLADPDRETCCEAARTLGAIADPEAGKPLLALVAQTADAKVFAAGAEALARLREPAVMPLLVARLQTTPNGVLRKSLRLIIADLFGNPGEFYKVLTKEHRTHGREVDRLLATLRDQDGSLRQAASAIECAYEQDNVPQCAEALAALLSHLATGPGSPKRDLTTRYLAALRAPWPSATGPDQREMADVLLAIYLICQLAH